MTCDRCGKEVKTLVDVGAGKRYWNPSESGGGTYTFYQITAEWCENCCVEMGIGKINEVPKKDDPKKTIEDFIRLILSKGNCEGRNRKITI